MHGDIWRQGDTNVRKLDFARFSTRLAQAIAWCHPRNSLTNPASSLRTDAFCPPLLCCNNRDEVVCYIGRERERALGPLAPELHERRIAMPDLRGGRLLAYFPDATLSDGAAAETSRGFFDAHNIPAWDTWVAYFEDSDPRDTSYAKYVVCYLPPALLDLAEAGIRVNPELCIAWLTDARTELTEVLNSGAVL